MSEGEHDVDFVMFFFWRVVGWLDVTFLYFWIYGIGVSSV
jgi:hypothetical protein